MKTGAKVRLIQPVVEGVVLKRRINEATDEVEVLVEVKEPNGEPSQRWFDQAQLEVADEPAAEGASQ